MGSSEDGPSQAVVAVAALAAGLVAQKVVSAGWKFVRGSEPGKDDSPLPEMLAFAAVSAGAIAVARTFAMQRARRIGAK